MLNRVFRMMLVTVFAMWMIQLSAAEERFSGVQANQQKDQAYAGTWAGSYSSEGGGSGNVSYILSKDDKGLWRGTVKYSNQNGEQTAELKSLRIADGRLSAKIESPDGEAEITLEGNFHGDKLEGTYRVSPKGSSDVAEKGTWSTTKGSSSKKQQ